MRIGVLGTGSFARRGPLPAITLAGMELEAIYDMSPAAAAEAEQLFKPKYVCGSVQELLSLKTVDAVFIASPPSSHLDVVSAVIAAGKPFVCEKPITLCSADALKLAELARKPGLPNAVDHEFRYDPGMLMMKQLIADGYLGKVRNSLLSVIVAHSVNPQYEALIYWNFNHVARMGGGVLPQLSSHLIDLHLHLFGGIEAKAGYLATMVPERPMPPEVRGGVPGPMRAVEAEDTVALAARLPNGAPAALSISWVAPCMPELRWAVHGDKGALVYQGNNGWFGGRLSGQCLGESAPGAIELPAIRRLESEQDRSRYQQDLIAALLRNFADVVGGKDVPVHYATLADDAKCWQNIERWRT
ncbi:MAG: oxidoreductase domain protein [Hydrocarboniphaga sp.]|uniref:Gfo/Idh/MocA family protein n=1 Tax=Hydrocarboniphaga sp. TaxID=2033016 RepID=UPI002618502F|nr:Gfo/Idh/MocA family oxidoreductase [Hydrocarboniphaga sp.]MDB5970060.1 oxidoreductase domain protein [Hydrocarboniphaga sp.]